MTANPITGLVKAPRATWQFMKEAREELRKVSWPNRQTTIQYTILVVVSSVVIGFLTGGVDFLLTRLLETIL